MPISASSDLPDLPDLLTADEVADLTRVSLRTARSWIAHGDLPTVRLGRKVYVTRAALSAFLDAATRPATCGPLAGRTA